MCYLYNIQLNVLIDTNMCLFGMNLEIKISFYGAFKGEKLTIAYTKCECGNNSRKNIWVVKITHTSGAFWINNKSVKVCKYTTNTSYTWHFPVRTRHGKHVVMMWKIHVVLMWSLHGIWTLKLHELFTWKNVVYFMWKTRGIIHVFVISIYHQYIISKTHV